MCHDVSYTVRRCTGRESSSQARVAGEAGSPAVSSLPVGRSSLNVKRMGRLSLLSHSIDSVTSPAGACRGACGAISWARCSALRGGMIA